MRHYIYKMTTDNGGAPCVTNDLLTLAICKPQIRSTARKGDWIYGFGGKDLGGRFLYVAKVADRFAKGAYYRLPEYARRGDCIYHYKGDTLELRPTAKYHKKPENKDRDIGLYSDYVEANVLISEDFRYFGDKGEALDSSEYPLLAALLAKLTQGHRVNHDPELIKELGKLHDKWWDAYPNIKKIGSPTHKDLGKCCSGDGGCVVCDKSPKR